MTAHVAPPSESASRDEHRAQNTFGPTRLTPGRHVACHGLAFDDGVDLHCVLEPGHAARGIDHQWATRKWAER